jgi:hypothetical protein
MIERTPRPDPAGAWKLLEQWIADNAKTPSGDTSVSAAAVKVLAIGAYIGCRFALIHPSFAIAIAEAGNKAGGPVLDPLKEAFARDYAEHLALATQNYFLNYGFDAPAVFRVNEKGTPEEKDEPLTEQDAKQIMEGLDSLFRVGGAKAK